MKLLNFEDSEQHLLLKTYVPSIVTVRVLDNVQAQCVVRKYVLTRLVSAPALPNAIDI